MGSAKPERNMWKRPRTRHFPARSWPHQRSQVALDHTSAESVKCLSPWFLNFIAFPLSMFSFLILCFFGPFCLFFFLLIHNFSFKFCIPNQFHRTANTTLPGQEYLIQKYNVCHLPVFGRSSSQFLHTHTHNYVMFAPNYAVRHCCKGAKLSEHRCSSMLAHAHPTQQSIRYPSRCFTWNLSPYASRP